MEGVLTADVIAALYDSGKEALVAAGAWDPSAPDADLLSVDFADGAIADRAQNRTFSGNGGTVAADSVRGANVAAFCGDARDAWMTPWSEADYAKINDGKWDGNGQPMDGDGSTFESAFKVEKFAGGRAAVFGNMTGAGSLGGAGVGFEVLPHSDGLATLVLYMKSPDSSYAPNITLEGALEYGRWYHAAAVFDGYEIALYLDGVRRGTSRQWEDLPTPAEAARFFVIGGDIADDGAVESPFSGSIAYVGIHSAALSWLQIETLAERSLSAGAPKPPTDGASASIAGSARAYEGTLARYSVSVGNIENLSAIALKVSYDADRLEFDGIRSPRPGDLIDVDARVNAGAGGARGTLDVIVVIPREGFDFGEQSELIELQFWANAPGEGDVTIESARYAQLAAAEKAIASIEPRAALTVVYSYDVTGDGAVDLADLSFLAAAYMLKAGDSGWEQAKTADFNGDGVVDIQDITYVIRYLRFIWRG
jgi:hypothetical protein